MKVIILVLLAALALTANPEECDACFKPNLNENCADDGVGLPSYTLHMSVHPHLDAYWIFNFDSYYDPQPTQGEVRGYFASNRFTSVKQIFNTATEVLWESRRLRESANKTQEAHRSFFNSEMGFFKHWFKQQSPETQEKVRELLKTKYWQILGGGFVQHDEGCAYYEDIIQNFEIGLHFLKQQFNYYPRVAISADSFGHSQSTLAILAHLGVEGFFVQRSDEHILLQNKTQFIWRARSSNGKVYGALPTHIRWAIHGFQDQFIGGNIQQNFCETKQRYIQNMRNQNSFLKRILKSTHIMRYFGHDFQEFNAYSYAVIEGIMKQFSREKCNKVVALYGNPTEYFISLMGEVFGQKVKPLVNRTEDIFPIWDYDSGLYWTGYFTTDAYHKKDYRVMGQLLRGARKFFLPIYLAQPDTLRNKQHYQKLQQLAEQVSYLQHHDGISGTSKYRVMDALELKNQELFKYVNDKILGDVFENEFPLGTNTPMFICHISQKCVIPKNNPGDIYLKILNSDGNPNRDPVIIDLPVNEFYEPNCEYELNCFCFELKCPCKLYLYKPLSTYTAIRLVKKESFPTKSYKLQTFQNGNQYSHSETHFKIKHSGRQYQIGYKKVVAKGTGRQYQHLSRYGTQTNRNFNIRPGKYALGNDPNQTSDFSRISSVSTLQSPRYTFFLIHWKRYSMKTLISIPASKPNEWKVETITASQGYHLQDLYLQVITPIGNQGKFVTDSNGWLTVDREMFKHEDYKAHFSKDKWDDLDGNSYPATAFAYIKDNNDKVSVNLDRPQGITSYRAGTLWVNFERLSEDDGKWVYESAYRSEYQRYTHVVTVKNDDYNERAIQRRYDQPLFIQGNLVSPSQRIQPAQVDFSIRNHWNSVSNIDDLKFSLRPFNDTNTILRLQNMHDEREITVGVFAGRHSPLLTTFYGRSVSFGSITEQSLGGNMDYAQFINSKWNWHNVVDLTQDNRIFNKIFRENITLAPLQIRTFLIKDLKFDQNCIEVSQLAYNKLQTKYELNINKAQPTRDALTVAVQKEIIKFMQDGDHCSGYSPVLQKKNINVHGNGQSGKDDRLFEPKNIQKTIEIQAKNQPNDQNKALNNVRPTETSTPQQIKHPEIQAVAPTPDVFSKPINQMDNKLIESFNSNTLLQLRKKVDGGLRLSVQEKQIYFTNKLLQIRRIKGIKA